jgi:hypothetical protein
MTPIPASPLAPHFFIPCCFPQVKMGKKFKLFQNFGPPICIIIKNFGPKNLIIIHIGEPKFLNNYKKKFVPIILLLLSSWRSEILNC